MLSREHSRLLDQSQVYNQSYGVVRPPPIGDNFKAAYAKLRADISAGTVTGLDIADFPDPPPAIPAYHVLAPERLMQLDMKLRNNLLSLITSKGRRGHYQQLALSGCALLLAIAADAKAAASLYVQTPHTRKLKAQLDVLKKVTLTKISMVEFDEIRDSIEDINDQLDIGDKMTDVQLCDHFIGLIHKLDSQGLRIALEIKLTSNTVPYGNVDKTLNAIAEVLTSFLVSDEINAIDSETNGRLLIVTEDSPKDDPKRLDWAKAAEVPPSLHARFVAECIGPINASRIHAPTSRHKRRRRALHRLLLLLSPTRASRIRASKAMQLLQQLKSQPRSMLATTPAAPHRLMFASRLPKMMRATTSLPKL